MRPSDHLSGQPFAPVVRSLPDTTVDGNIVRFLATSARYLQSSARKPATLEPEQQLNW